MMAFMAVMAVTAQAGDEKEFTVTSGNFVEITSQPGKTATVEFDYDKAKVGNLTTKDISNETLVAFLKKNDEKAFEKWDAIQADSKKYFINRWNEEKKSRFMFVEDGKADYKVKIHADQIDTGNAGAATWSMSKRDGGVVMNGSLEIIDTKSGKQVCKVKINRYKGASRTTFDVKNANFNRRMQMFHKSLAKDLLGDVKN